jgi:hypothetical protein
MRLRRLLPAALLLCSTGYAQAPSKPEPDTLILVDGEKLIGHFIRSNGTGIRFKSDLAGEVTIDWSKVQELHTAKPFAVVSKNVRPGKKPAEAEIPQGPLNAREGQIEIATEAGPKVVPVQDAAHVIEVPEYRKAFESRPNILTDWKGTITAGASLVEATQNSRTFTESIALVRGIPTEDWLPRRNRTTLDFSSTYGHLSQPLTPTVKTSIFHADAERDEYFSAAAYGFGQTQFDHNFSQGLDLQQTYSGGIGWTVIRRPNETLDLKGGISYIRQQFSIADQNQNLASSIFDEKFLRKFNKGATFAEELSVSPAWNNTNALSALANATLAIPVYKRLTFTTGVVDNFLNDPPPGFRKNSFQFTTGLTYVLP